MTIENLAFIDHDDPHGNGQPTKEIVLVDGDTVIHTNTFISVHGGGPLNLRLVHGNAPAGAGPAFEIGPAGSLALTITTAGRLAVSSL